MSKARGEISPPRVGCSSPKLLCEVVASCDAIDGDQVPSALMLSQRIVQGDHYALNQDDETGHLEVLKRDPSSLPHRLGGVGESAEHQVERSLRMEGAKA